MRLLFSLLLLAPLCAHAQKVLRVQSTALGETRVVHPGEGSTLTMNTNSAMVVIFAPPQREVYLLRGEASFSIARDSARPSSR